ncbi:NADH:flavin oxidoreductase [Anaerostipes sp.]|uniref:NADH:flavin oxidoreductase n=1 Tax=Anaerostipes sp. TaxID=1872530 RepID=UPI0025B84FAE|nr:NADH:flavin oxidoreductase [Anaerostipes sp.]MBS7007153.1 NADH:flavin oxidoreductase [Anaerostipes sp.]
MYEKETVIKGKKIKSPFLMAPMVTFGYGAEDGMITEELISHYEERARGEVGMIIVEAACISEDGRLSAQQIGIWKDEQTEGHKKLVSAVHACGVPILSQLHHAGIRTVSGKPAAPSKFHGMLRGKEYTAEEMSGEEIRKRERQFVQAAVRAKEAGYDGVEIHCAHSYLLSAFLSPTVNHRTDRFGGDIRGRMQMTIDILSEIRQSCGEDFIISVRLGFDEPDLDASAYMAKEFEKAGMDLLNVSTGFGSTGFMDERTMETSPDGFPFNIRVWGAMQMKQRVKCPVIAVGGIRQAQQGLFLLEQGCTDFVALGRALLCDPHWVKKMKQGREIVLCRNCRKCLWSTDYHKCPGWREYHG